MSTPHALRRQNSKSSPDRNVTPFQGRPIRAGVKFQVGFRDLARTLIPPGQKLLEAKVAEKAAKKALKKAQKPSEAAPAETAPSRGARSDEADLSF